jgi:endonuclease/exonuclease/phosphatase family metal-dependent hydrolase
MAIKIASWNVEGRLSGYTARGRGSVDHILRGIEALGADIIVLPEAYLEQTAEPVDKRLKSLGFEWRDCRYSRNERDWSKEFMGKVPSIRVLSQLEMRDVYVEGRQRLLAFTVQDPETGVDIRVFAVHLDDRNEALREGQVEALLPMLEKIELPTVMVGDFNAMWAKGRAQLLRSPVVRLIARHIPHAGLRYTAVRLTEMAAGRVLGRLAEV